METKRETAVEWLAFILKSNFNMDIYHTTAFYSAKKMEKEQIKHAFVECWGANVPDGIECKLDAEQYYNETYGK